MKSEPILLYHIRPTPDDVSLGRLIEFFGLDGRTVDTYALDAELNRAADHDLCILASATTLEAWRRHLPHQATALDILRQKASLLFVYGFAPEMSPAYVAAKLSDGAIVDVSRLTRTDIRYEVSSSQPEITREFSGLSFGGVRDTTDFGFVCTANSRGAVPLVTIQSMPFWVVIEKNGCKTFLLACSEIADIHEQVNDIDATRYFSRLLPAAMFLRSAFQSRCWHSKRRTGNFIIDDPPLKRSYGYLNYRDLVSKMDTCDFASTIAFIPWNYQRTDNEVIQLFRQRPDRLSLCVHGCNHTAAEFSTADLAVLNSKVQLASARMNALRRQNGLSYSKTMVFPQGRFSTSALRALKSNNYLAALNYSASPADSGGNAPLTVADFLAPAIMKYGGVPLFLRRYPCEPEQFAFDLFFGKPILVVEHHAYLNDGGKRLVEFISRLNSFEKLQWSGLHEIMTKSYLEREISDEITACRLHTNHQVVENQDERDRTFILTKFEPDDVPIQEVLVNGQTTKFTVEGEALKFEMRIPAFSSAVVTIAYRNLLPHAESGEGFAGRSRVWTRRMLSELRDNILCRTKLLFASSRALNCGFAGYSAPASTQQNHVPARNSMATGISARAQKHVCADDIARGILGPNSNATISTVLVAGTENSTPLKRVEIHLDHPEQVPAFFNLLTATLKGTGIHLRATRSSAIPVTDIWLTCPLGDRSRMQSCAPRIAEQVDAGIATPAQPPQEQDNNLQVNRQPAAAVDPERSHFARQRSGKSRPTL